MASTHRAAVYPGLKQPLEAKQVTTEEPAAGEVLVRNHVVAIQPLDSKMLIGGYGPASNLIYPAVLGSSGGGVIEAVGEGISHLQVGDRVAFDSSAYVKLEENLKTGTWQERVICNGKTVAKIGEIAFEQAVLVGMPLQTAVAALNVFLGMSTPGSGSGNKKVLIWGAGGAVGSYAVQFAKQVGHTVVVTASPRDLERQKRLGASEVIDYKSPDAVEQLRKLGPYDYLFTASGDPASQKAMVSLLESTGGKFGSVLPPSIEIPANVEIVYAAFSLVAAQTEEHSEWRDWWYQKYLPSVLSDGLVEPVSFTKVEGGLSSLQQAAQDVFEGKIRGKLVVDLSG